MQTHVNSRVLRTPNFATDAAKHIVASGLDAISKTGVFRLGLAGGNTPKAVYAELSGIARDLPWDRVQVTFGDERCVAHDHSDSNYKMAHEALLSRVPIPEGNIFRIRGEIDADQAAAEYEARLASVAARFGETRYRHDLLLLGLGEDGHTASLFPGYPALDEQERSVVPTLGPKPPPQRVTFTFPLINASKAVVFLVNDRAKEPVIQRALKGEFPSGRVAPQDGGVLWLLGHEA
jgi:6-phosphogluconolactonase